MAVTGYRGRRTLFDEDQGCYRTSSGNREKCFGRGCVQTSAAVDGGRSIPPTPLFSGPSDEECEYQSHETYRGTSLGAWSDTATNRKLKHLNSVNLHFDPTMSNESLSNSQFIGKAKEINVVKDIHNHGMNNVQSKMEGTIKRFSDGKAEMISKIEMLDEVMVGECAESRNANESLDLFDRSPLDTIACDSHDRPFKKEHDHRNFRDCRWVSESSNGLFCTVMIDPPDHDFFVYNPSTRESKKIPNIESEKESYDWMFPTLHGFGYAESIDDYKFVKFFTKRKIIQIFSLRNNSWKTIKCDFLFNVNNIFPLFGFSLNEALHYGIPLNGAIHWMVAVVDYDIGHRFWIMEEYGVKESLTRISIPKKPYPYKCTWKNIGYLFMNLDDDGWLQRDYDSTVFDGIRNYTMHAYVENLVSLNFHRRRRQEY
ncbi:hypothetical protein EZV62_011906 [Acer yangbiense]|uniref:F-box associated beta-propeller type 3 domain-containing protein n=1 Tax=Acer yangbiense TaxID=1000413 RepID=A0A5C7I8J0_9ROSI|nr:hypothetical protein EZV62_011906 [Acer yangbiense]